MPFFVVGNLESHNCNVKLPTFFLYNKVYTVAILGKNTETASLFPRRIAFLREREERQNKMGGQKTFPLPDGRKWARK